MKKYLVIDEREHDIFTTVCATLKEANKEAENQWEGLTTREKKAAHVYVLDVRSEDLDDPEDWCSFTAGGFCSGRFDSEEEERKMVFIESYASYTEDGAEVSTAEFEGKHNNTLEAYESAIAHQIECLEAGGAESIMRDRNRLEYVMDGAKMYDVVTIYDEDMDELEYKGYWYAAMKDDEDTDWGYGSYDLEEATRMAKEFKDGYVVKVEEGHDPVAVDEFREV